MGIYACLTFKMLKNLGNNDIIITCRLDAYSVPQPLHVGVFSRPKENVKRRLNQRTFTTRKDLKNDIISICEVFCYFYHNSATAVIAICGFRKSY